MRLVVTGTGGQVVTALRDLARSQSHVSVVPVGRPDCDLENPRSVAAAIAAARPDIIINAAAYTQVDQAEVEPERAHLVNAEGAAAVARAAASLDVPVIQISTDYVFDGQAESRYREEDATSPINVYGRTKLGGEIAVAAATRNHVILRTSWVYAARGHNFLTTMLRLARERKDVAVVADQCGAPTYAADLAQAIVSAARTLLDQPGDMTLRGVFHATADGETTWAGFAAAIFAAAHARGGPRAAVRPIPAVEYPRPARRPNNSRLDNGKLLRRYGIALPPWQDGLARCIDQIMTKDTTR